MPHRLLTLIAILASFTVPSAAQSLAKKTWSAPLSSDGHPDLEGTWSNKSATPLERPKQLEGRQFLTDDEVAELKKRADRIFRDGRSDAATGDNVFLAALANPNREEHHEFRNWSGGGFDPRRFDVGATNRALSKIKP